LRKGRKDGKAKIPLQRGGGGGLSYCTIGFHTVLKGVTAARSLPETKQWNLDDIIKCFTSRFGQKEVSHDIFFSLSDVGSQLYNIINYFSLNDLGRSPGKQTKLD
jgi:hypothetical protein